MGTTKKVVKLSLPKKGLTDTYFIAGDWHTKAVHDSSYHILLKHAKQLPKSSRNLIVNGDFLDAEHLMKRGEGFKKWIKSVDGMEEYFIPLSEDEFSWGKDVLSSLKKVFNKIYFVYGNHDWRYDWFSTICPSQYAFNFNLRLQLRLDDFCETIIGYNNWLDIGPHLCITHGMFHGTSACKNHYQASGGNNVIFSHVHHYECKSFRARGDVRNAISLPAMCELNPDYIKNTDNNWSNGYGVINMRSTGKFNFNVFQIWDNELILPCGTSLKG